MVNFIEASGTPNLIEEDAGRSAPALASSSALRFPGMLQCTGIHTSDTLVKRLKKGLDNGDIPNDPRVIHKTRYRINGDLTVRKD